MKKKKLLIGMLGTILILILIVISNPFSHTAVNNDSAKNKSVNLSTGNEIDFPVNVAVVRKGDLITWINTSGYAFPVWKYEIKPKLSGQVTELNAFNGKSVTKHELLFKLDDTQYQLDVNQAKSDLIKSQIEYELQKSSPVAGNGSLTYYLKKLDSIKVIYAHEKKLYDNNKISYEEFNRVARDYETLKTIATLNREDVVASRSGLTNAATNYEKAKLNLSYTELNAPIAGLIDNCSIALGSYVTQNQSCMSVIDISSIKMQCEVTESDLVNIHHADPVEADFIALPGKVFKGKVIEVNPSVDLAKRTALVTVLLLNPGRQIKPGMFASVKIGTRTYADKIIIPHSALLVRENRTLVFTVEDELAMWKYITVGQSNDQYYAVGKGLNAGDTLIIDGNYNLAHQSKVRIVAVKKY